MGFCTRIFQTFWHITLWYLPSKSCLAQCRLGGAAVCLLSQGVEQNDSHTSEDMLETAMQLHLLQSSTELIAQAAEVQGNFANASANHSISKHRTGAQRPYQPYISRVGSNVHRSAVMERLEATARREKVHRNRFVGFAKKQRTWTAPIQTSHGMQLTGARIGAVRTQMHPKQHIYASSQIRRRSRLTGLTRSRVAMNSLPESESEVLFRRLKEESQHENRKHSSERPHDKGGWKREIPKLDHGVVSGRRRQPVDLHRPDPAAAMLLSDTMSKAAMRSKAAEAAVQRRHEEMMVMRERRRLNRVASARASAMEKQFGPSAVSAPIISGMQPLVPGMQPFMPMYPAA